MCACHCNAKIKYHLFLTIQQHTDHADQDCIVIKCRYVKSSKELKGAFYRQVGKERSHLYLEVQI